MAIEDIFNNATAFMVSLLHKFISFKLGNTDINPIFSPNLRNKEINVLSIRSKKAVSIENSLCFTVKMPANDINVDKIKWIGWEINDQKKYLPKCASMADSMDPQK